MSRISIAEETLLKEVKVHQLQIEWYERDIAVLRGKIDTLTLMKNHIEREANRIHHVREAKSKRNKS